MALVSEDDPLQISTDTDGNLSPPFPGRPREFAYNKSEPGLPREPPNQTASNQVGAMPPTPPRPIKATTGALFDSCVILRQPLRTRLSLSEDGFAHGRH
jgi:hypothetical protein